MKIKTSRIRWLSAAVGVSLVLAVFAGCGSDEPATSAPTAVPTSAPTSAPATSPTTAPTAAVAATEAEQPTSAPADTPAPTEPPVEVGHMSGQMAPDFMLTTLEGEPVSLGDFQNRPVMLYFYTSW